MVTGSFTNWYQVLGMQIGNDIFRQQRSEIFIHFTSPCSEYYYEFAFLILPEFFTEFLTTFYNYRTGLANLVICVVAAISLILTSIGIRLSYSVGACKIIPAVPTTTAIVKIHRNKRSSTIATNFQSSFT